MFGNRKGNGKSIGWDSIFNDDMANWLVENVHQTKYTSSQRTTIEQKWVLRFVRPVYVPHRVNKCGMVKVHRNQSSSTQFPRMLTMFYRLENSSRNVQRHDKITWMNLLKCSKFTVNTPTISIIGHYRVERISQLLMTFTLCIMFFVSKAAETNRKILFEFERFLSC